MPKSSLRVATCQFPVSDRVPSNWRHIARQMRQAAARGAAIVHFPEGALSGYAGTAFQSFDEFDWELLKEYSQEVMHLAAELRVWVLLGSSHPLSRGEKPHNCIYVINDRGKLVDRYDKRFCAGDRQERTGDLRHYTPGDHACVFNVRGIRCGALICHDYRYPELYRDYRKRGVQLVFHSYHAANCTPQSLAKMRAEVGAEFHHLNRGSTYPEITMPAAMQAYAASSHLWISCSNSSARESCWPAFFVRADGVITGRLRRNRSGVLISTVDPTQVLYDSTRDWRDRAMRGIFHSGNTSLDPRSLDRKAL